MFILILFHIYKRQNCPTKSQSFKKYENLNFSIKYFKFNFNFSIYKI